MNSSSTIQTIQSKINAFYHLTMTDDDTKIKNAIHEVLNLWPEILTAANEATDDELFTLNVSRAVLTQVFTIVLSKEFFNKDHLLVREIFFGCFNLLVDHLSIFKNTDLTPITIFIDSNVRLIMKMITSICSLVNFTNEDFSKIEDHQLLIAMREHIDQDNKHDNLTDGIISFIWNLSDRTILIPLFINTGYPESVVQWIKIRESKFRDDKLDAPIHILHNLSRHDDGIKALNCHGALDVIEEIKIEPKICHDPDDITIHIAMIRVLLTAINQIRFDSIKYSNEIINMIIKLSIDSVKNDRSRYNGSHVSEPLTVIVKLFHNDEILHSTFTNNETKATAETLIELLQSYLIKFYPRIDIDDDILENYTCTVILNLFWLVSNHKKYRQIVGNNQALMDIIKQAADDELNFVDKFMPRTMKSIKQSANEILKNINS
ncbi:unnamed protein product [Rotaria magnacalcarata]|uniref:Uncharacterized protein n=4 Tax=Rotaria magnacalcarata TaxID=392030 RepID=A0A816VK83_9BILA|nr:unnamed protein product [Rotaria magnacalcarata]CAF1396854.1 unnamed protein product [Rotaria magnacalcarata]CAF2122023.1 unnamed protein product [Rotaria magnacalcarata]CAF4023712.1 unnamed protein product [Rotaria magnacalcarata]CAF4426956.1 unnamed protein product [Rotaria magnacalcarata]